MDEQRKTLFEVRWREDNAGKLTACDILPITVLREGILPGCTAVSITFRDSEGRIARGTPGDYFPTREVALAATAEELQQTITSLEDEAAELTADADRIGDVIKSLVPAKA